jgi:hypothetical protein
MTDHERQEISARHPHQVGVLQRNNSIDHATGLDHIQTIQTPILANKDKREWGLLGRRS